MEQTKLDASKRASANLKNLIKSRGYTQDRFACEVMYVDPTTFRKWLKNGIKDINTIERICEFFDVDFMTLLK